jgi:hypothetical protein
VLAQLVVGCSDIYGKISSSHELSPITANTILAINTNISRQNRKEHRSVVLLK